MRDWLHAIRQLSPKRKLLIVGLLLAVMATWLAACLILATLLPS